MIVYTPWGGGLKSTVNSYPSKLQYRDVNTQYLHVYTSWTPINLVRSRLKELLTDLPV